MMGTPSTATPIRKWKLPPPFFPNSSSSSVKRIPFSSATKTPKKLLLLTDWWLIKTDDVTPTLGVAGTTRTESTIRTFHSGEIVKRHDEVTLETKDGFTITLVGLINRLHTLQNGIPLEVCNHFVLGFPYDWEEFGAQCFGEGTTCGAPSKKICTLGLKMSQNDAKSMLPVSFDDLPVTRVRDLMMLPSGNYTESRINRSIFYHMVTMYSCSSVHLNEESDGQTKAKDPLLKEARPSPDSNEENNRLVMTKNCLLDKSLTNQVTNKDGKRHKNDSTIIEIAPGREAESQSMHNYVDARWLHRGVCTRSKERFKKSSNNQEEGLSSNTFTRSVSTTEAVWSNCGGKIAEKNTSTVIVGDSTSYTVHSESTMIVNSYNQSKGRLLRSKSKSQTLTNNSKEDGLHSETSTPPVSTSKASGNHCGGSMAETNVNPSVIMSEQNKEISNVLDSPGISRSGKRRRVDISVFARGEHSSGLSVNDQAEIFSSTTRNANLTEQISASEVFASRCGVSVTRTNASRSCLLDKPSQDHRERTLYEPATRLSNQLNNSSTGIFTRSKARLNRLRSDPIENIVEVEVPVGDSAVIRSADNTKLSVSSPTSVAFGSSKKSASSRKLFPTKKQTNGAPDGSALRRSNRIRNQRQCDTQHQEWKLHLVC